MGWPRPKTKEQGVQGEFLNSGNARNRKNVKILNLQCLGEDHDELKVIFPTASLRLSKKVPPDHFFSDVVFNYPAKEYL